MSIDARITGIRIKGSDVSLVLESRDGKTPPGQPVIWVDNPPDPIRKISALLDGCIWGGSNDIMLGDTKIADRTSYTSIKLVEPMESWIHLCPPGNGAEQS